MRGGLLGLLTTTRWVADCNGAGFFLRPSKGGGSGRDGTYPPRVKRVPPRWREGEGGHGPESLASWMAKEPTPPAAPVMRMVCPRRTFSLWYSARYAVLGRGGGMGMGEGSQGRGAVGRQKFLGETNPEEMHMLRKRECTPAKKTTQEKTHGIQPEKSSVRCYIKTNQQ